MKTPKLAYVILCDDIRREDNGKLILIGMYADLVLVKNLPVELPSLTFYCRWILEPDCGLTGVYEVYTPDGDRAYKIEAAADDPLPPAGFVGAALAIKNFRFKSEGTHTLVFKPAGGRRRKLFKFGVSVVDTLPS